MTDPAARFWELWQKFREKILVQKALLDQQLAVDMATAQAAAEEAQAATRSATEAQARRDAEIIEGFKNRLNPHLLRYKVPHASFEDGVKQPLAVAPLRSAGGEKNNIQEGELPSKEAIEKALTRLEQLTPIGGGVLAGQSCASGCAGFWFVGILVAIITIDTSLSKMMIPGAYLGLLAGAFYPYWLAKLTEKERGLLTTKIWAQLMSWSKALELKRAAAQDAQARAHAVAQGAAEALARNRYEQGMKALEQSSLQFFEKFADFKSEQGIHGEPWSSTLPPIAGRRIDGLRVGRVWLLDSPFDVNDEQIPVVVPWNSLLMHQVKAEELPVLRQLVVSLLFRYLVCLPPGKVRFLFIDPVGLGDNVKQLLSLGAHDPELVYHQAWSEPQHIEKQLADLTAHVEVVIQKYLQAEFRTLEEYNEKAGEIAEPYRILVYFDYPTCLTQESARRLASLVKHGPRCGVIPLIVVNHKFEQDLAQFSELDGTGYTGLAVGEIGAILAPSNVLSGHDMELSKELERWTDSWTNHRNEQPRSVMLIPDEIPPELAASIIEKFGSQAKAGKHVEVAFEKVLGDHDWWKGDASQTVSVPLGPSGARQVQHFTLGTGTGLHALIIGRTGSGKSNLMHVIISGIARLYPPSEVQLALIDFKKGVEFKSYANLPLPHARVIAIESEREFGLSVLEGVDRELQERGELFRARGVQSLAEYREVSGEKMPRFIILVDEFQEFFAGDDAISQKCAALMDRLVRQGRAFGIHLVLGSQSLAGMAGQHRGMLDQMNVRIALQCSDADSRLVLADDNPQARLLSRPGEGIYNDAGGLVEGNHKFQVALFSKEDRERHFEMLRELATGSNFPKPIVFEGHEPARLEACAPLLEALSKGPRAHVKSVDGWVGEPLAIRPPTAIRFQRRSGRNLLVVHREEAAGCGVLQALLAGLSAQLPAESAAFYIVDFALPDGQCAELADSLKSLLPQPVTILGRRDLQGVLQRGVEEINARHADRERAAKSRSEFLVFLGFHQARDLRQSDDYGYGYGQEGPSLPSLFSEFVREGPDVGFHTLLWCDTAANLMRALDRRSLNEFNARIVGPLSAQDSLTLLDDPAASKLDRPNRMIFFDEDKPGVLESFRPYSLVSEKKLRKLVVE